eukprot:1133330-Pleurochrysis_carterae.AAC.2
MRRTRKSSRGYSCGFVRARMLLSPASQSSTASVKLPPARSTAARLSAQLTRSSSSTGGRSVSSTCEPLMQGLVPLRVTGRPRLRSDTLEQRFWRLCNADRAKSATARGPSFLEACDCCSKLKPPRAAHAFLLLLSFSLSCSLSSFSPTLRAGRAAEHDAVCVAQAGICASLVALRVGRRTSAPSAPATSPQMPVPLPSSSTLRNGKKHLFLSLPPGKSERARRGAQRRVVPDDLSRLKGLERINRAQKLHSRLNKGHGQST